MNIKTYSLLTLITLCSASTHGMENNNTYDFDKTVVGMLHNLARQSVQNLYKNIEIAEKKEKFKLTYNKNRQFMYSNKVNDLTAQEKSDLLVSLQQNNQLIEECYSAEETWSVETHDHYCASKQVIRHLEQR